MHGFIVIDKPTGMTSASIVNKVKKLLPKGTKIGHTGTLDPNVTGVLALAIGRATKSIAYLNNERKCYRCSMQFGLKTDTADIWGEVIKKQDVNAFDLTQINDVLNTLSGKIKQVPPMYSAAKHQGKRLYQLARSGQIVERQAKLIEIFNYRDIVYQHPFLHFTVICSRGTYVRTLCEDIANELGTLACMTALCRTLSGPFRQCQALSLTQLTTADISDKLLPIEIMFDNLIEILVDYKHAVHLLNGVKVDLKRFIEQPLDSTSKLYTVYYKTFFIGVAETIGKQIRLKTLFTDNASLEEYHDHLHKRRTSDIS